MKLPATAKRFARSVAAAAHIGAQQLRLRSAIVGGAAVAVIAVCVAGEGATPWFVVVVLAGLAVASAVRPDTHVALGFVIVFAALWLGHVDRRTSPLVLVAAAGLAVVHIASAAAALGPPEAGLPATLVAGWVRRSGLVLAGTAAVWLATVVMGSLDASASALLTGAALVAVAAGGWLLNIRSRPDPTGGL